MKVFISWSGEESKAVARELRTWVRQVLQAAEPWMSQMDIDKGERWNSAIAKQLHETKAGIICLTPTNLSAPWILFEAGALAKTIDEKTRVCPYLIRLRHSDVPARGPLAQFQLTEANRDETFQMVQTLNRVMEKPLEGAHLEETFSTWWPRLKEKLSKIEEKFSQSGPAVPEPRNERDILEDLLGLSRHQIQKLDALEKLVRAFEANWPGIFSGQTSGLIYHRAGELGSGSSMRVSGGGHPFPSVSEAKSFTPFSSPLGGQNDPPLGGQNDPTRTSD
jgi:hypothetical protein